jgi:hypothetical protein
MQKLASGNRVCATSNSMLQNIDVTSIVLYKRLTRTDNPPSIALEGDRV